MRGRNAECGLSPLSSRMSSTWIRARDLLVMDKIEVILDLSDSTSLGTSFKSGRGHFINESFHRIGVSEQRHMSNNSMS